MGTEYRHPLVKHLPNLKQELQNQHKEDPEKLSMAILDLEKLSYYLEATCFSVRELLLKANELAHESGERSMKGMNILV